MIPGNFHCTRFLTQTTNDPHSSCLSQYFLLSSSPNLIAPVPMPTYPNPPIMTTLYPIHSEICCATHLILSPPCYLTSWSMYWSTVILSFMAKLHLYVSTYVSFWIVLSHSEWYFQVPSTLWKVYWCPWFYHLHTTSLGKFTKISLSILLVIDVYVVSSFQLL